MRGGEREERERGERQGQRGKEGHNERHLCPCLSPLSLSLLSLSLSSLSLSPLSHLSVTTRSVTPRVLLFIIAEKARARGEEVERSRSCERQTAEACGWSRLARRRDKRVIVYAALSY